MQSDLVTATLSLDELRSVVKEVVAEEVKKIVTEEVGKLEHKCRISIDDEAAKAFGHFVGMVKDAGDGDFDKGVEQIRSNNKILRWQQKTVGKITNVVVGFLAVSIVGGVLTMLGLGLIKYIKGAISG